MNEENDVKENDVKENDIKENDVKEDDVKICRLITSHPKFLSTGQSQRRIRFLPIEAMRIFGLAPVKYSFLFHVQCMRTSHSTLVASKNLSIQWNYTRALSMTDTAAGSHSNHRYTLLHFHLRQKVECMDHSPPSNGRLTN